MGDSPKQLPRFSTVLIFSQPNLQRRAARAPAAEDGAGHAGRNPSERCAVEKEVFCLSCEWAARPSSPPFTGETLETNPFNFLQSPHGRRSANPPHRTQRRRRRENFSVLSSGERIAVAFLLDRFDLLQKAWGTMLESLDRLGPLWTQAAFHVQRYRGEDDNT